MIPDEKQLKQVAEMGEGNLAEVPYAVLLHALFVARRTAVLEIERKPLQKAIVFEAGVPVDCRSNLLHETLSRFMVSQGRLSEEQSRTFFSQATANGERFGEVLIREGLITASELFKVMQQNLARKLLDGFMLRSGSFRVRQDVPPVESPLAVKTAQLIVTGISRFAPDEEVNVAISPLVGQRLYLHPSPPHPLAEIRLRPDQRELVAMLSDGRRIDQLAAETSTPFEHIMRLLYSLAVIGVVVPEDRLPARPSSEAPEAGSPPPSVEPSASAPAGATPPTDAATEPDEALRDALMTIYLEHRTQDAFELLGLSEAASPVEIESAYLGFSRRCAPWGLAAAGLGELTEKAEELFVAGGRAFGELCDSERRNALVRRRQNLRRERRKTPDRDRYAIRSQLLDPEAQFRKGKVLMEAGRLPEARQLLQFAYDCDPQNLTYRSELAYCRYQETPAAPAAPLDELREVLRIDSEAGLASYYAGLILADQGDRDGAEEHLRRAIKQLMPDRRPIEALKTLQASRKKRRLLG